MAELMSEFCNAGRLSRVDALVDPVLPNDKKGVILTFDSGAIFTFGAREDDSIALDLGRPQIALEEKLCNVTSQFPWNTAVGKPARWIWTLVNQQGYRDAFQVEFANNVTDSSAIVQLVVVASSIRVLSVEARNGDG